MQITVKEMGPTNGGWDTGAKATFIWNATEQLSADFVDPGNGWISDIKTLKNGTRKLTIGGLLSGGTIDDFAARKKKWAEFMGATVDSVTVLLSKQQ